MRVENSSLTRGDLYNPLDAIPSFASFFSACLLPLSSNTSENLQYTISHVALFDILSELSDSSLDILSSLADPRYHSIFVGAKKKYKPVHLKTRPILAELLQEYRIIRDIKGDPLTNMPTINYAQVPDFVPTGRYTSERMHAIDELHPGDFLLPEERKLLHHFISLHHDVFAWDDSEHSRFKEEFFPPVEFPVVTHTPWVEKNISIPPGIYKEVCEVIKKKIDAGGYEPSNASYRSKWFPVSKKDGKSLRPVHALEPLNAITIQHSRVLLIPDHLMETFGGCACGGILDLYVGYDNRPLHEKSRDMTTFQMPYGLLRLTTLPMGWTNSVPIFHEDVTYILRDEIPEHTILYIDDVPVRGPASRYETAQDYEHISENQGIRCFVKEHFEVLNRICQRMKYAGRTYSGKKSILIASEYTVLSYRCTYNGRIPLDDKVQVIRNWGSCKSLSDVHAFLGTVDILRIFIRNFAHRAHHLVKLTRKGVSFEWTSLQQTAQEDLKQAVLECPALRAINYNSPALVVLSVNTSYIAVGYILAQCDEKNPRARFYSRFSSITLNDCEARFSQPKLEIYGVYHATKDIKTHIIGLCNLVLEVDAIHIGGMIRNPDLAPSTLINCWITYILNFHFKLVHVPGAFHGPDSLSHRTRQPDDPTQLDDDDNDFVDLNLLFMHLINLRHIHISSSHHRLALVCFTQSAEPGLSVTDDFQADGLQEYQAIPRSPAAQDADAKLGLVHKYLYDLERPPNMLDKEYSSFIKFALQFFPDQGRLCKCDSAGAHKLVLAPNTRIRVLKAYHDEAGHCGVFATRALVSERFWWPWHHYDIAWYIKTCHLCQVRQQQHIFIPPTVAQPSGLFSKCYMDTMFLPPSGGFKYLVQARCLLIHMPEFKALRRETGKTLGD